MTISLLTAFLVLLVAKQSIIAGINHILGTYCKGDVGKKGDKILAGWQKNRRKRRERLKEIEIALKRMMKRNTEYKITTDKSTDFLLQLKN